MVLSPLGGFGVGGRGKPFKEKLNHDFFPDEARFPRTAKGSSNEGNSREKLIGLSPLKRVGGEGA